MLKTILFTLVMNVLYFLSFGQSNRQFNGSVFDQKNKPVIGAKVVIRSINKNGITNALGIFTIDDLPQTFEIEISCMGYETLGIKLEKILDSIFYLNPKAIALKSVILSNKKVDVNQLIKLVKEDIPDKYELGYTRKKLFFREKPCPKW